MTKTKRQLDADIAQALSTERHPREFATDYLDRVGGVTLGWERNQGEPDGWVAAVPTAKSRAEAYSALKAAGVEVSKSEGATDEGDAGVLYLWAIVDED